MLSAQSCLLNDSQCTQIVFWQDGPDYLLESELRVLRLAEEGDSPNWFRIDDETLWRLTAARLNKAMIGDPETVLASDKSK